MFLGISNDFYKYKSFKTNNGVKCLNNVSRCILDGGSESFLLCLDGGLEGVREYLYPGTSLVDSTWALHTILFVHIAMGSINKLEERGEREENGDLAVMTKVSSPITGEMVQFFKSRVPFGNASYKNIIKEN